MFNVYPIQSDDHHGPTILMHDDVAEQYHLAGCPDCAIRAIYELNVSAYRLRRAGRERTFRVRHRPGRKQQAQADALFVRLLTAEPHPRWPTLAALEADPPEHYQLPMWDPDVAHSPSIH